MNFDRTISLVEHAIAQGIFPCASFAIGNQKEVFIKKSIGYKKLYPQKEEITENTLFDMASLSKVISTTMLALKAIEQGKLCLDDKLSCFYSDCFGKENVTIQNLLTHTSGISSHIPLYTLGIEKENSIEAILKSKLAYNTGENVVYSCMGYIILGDIIEKVLGDNLSSLATKMVFRPLGMTDSLYNPHSTDIASTEFDTVTNAHLNGVVHDENARFMGGVAGNAGVFCTLYDAIKFCTMLSQRGEGFLSERMFTTAIKNYTKGKEENRGLGFLLTGDVYNFAGQLFSEGSYGHTGFTGTSIMVDNQTGLYAILLTNRVHLGRENNKIIRFRKQFYNSIWGSI